MAVCCLFISWSSGFYFAEKTDIILSRSKLTVKWHFFNSSIRQPLFLMLRHPVLYWFLFLPLGLRAVMLLLQLEWIIMSDSNWASAHHIHLLRCVLIPSSLAMYSALVNWRQLASNYLQLLLIGNRIPIHTALRIWEPDCVTDRQIFQNLPR